jgi:NAD(P)-dependent dehydrogenase (short-subunit alcohol dehydrogenase family)
VTWFVDPGLTGPILNGPPQAREQVAAMVPVRRMGQAQEVAAAAVWLSSVQSSFVTGTTLSTVYRVYGDGGDPGKLLANAAAGSHRHRRHAA